MGLLRVSVLVAEAQAFGKPPFPRRFLPVSSG